MTTYSQTTTESIRLQPQRALEFKPTAGHPYTYADVLNDTVVQPLTARGDEFEVALGALLSQNLTIAPAQALKWKWVRTLTQNLQIHDALSSKATYHVTDTEIIRLADALRRTFPVVLSQNLTVHQAQTIAIGIKVLERLRLLEALSAPVTRSLTLTQAIVLNDALGRFFSAIVAETIDVSSALTRTYVTSPIMTQGLMLGDVLANTMVLQIVEKVTAAEVDVLKMIYSGQLTDDVVLTALYVAPNGTVTTWTINTRTNAVTEYTNYNFNSYASFGKDQYIAAANTGIYELTGSNDANSLICSDVMSGYAQLAGTKLAGIKGCYLAVRGEGQYVMKIIAGNGLEYVYQVQSQPNLMTTKVNVGKGIRARYIAFQLVTSTAFELDTLEFVPMLSARRV